MQYVCQPVKKLKYITQYYMSNLILNPVAHPTLDNIFDGYPQTKIFYLSSGSYNLTKTLNIVTENITLIGLSRNPDDVHLIQTSATDDAIHITADNVRIEFLSIHTENGQGMCIHQEKYNWTNI